MTVTVPNRIAKNYLPQVVAEMKSLGAPALRACWLEWEREWFFIKGSHRAVAAVKLELPITIIAVEWDDIVDDHDIDGLENEGGVTVGRIIEYVRERGKPIQIAVSIE